MVTADQRHAAENVFLQFKKSHMPYEMCRHILGKIGTSKWVSYKLICKFTLRLYIHSIHYYETYQEKDREFMHVRILNVSEILKYCLLVRTDLC